MSISRTKPGDIMVGRWIPAIVAWHGLLCAGLPATPPASASAPAGATTTSRPAPPPAGRFIKLELGTLFIPDALPHRQHEPDLLVHFHGDPATVAHNVVAARIQVPALIINYPGLSAAYAKPLREEPDLFDKALTRALHQLQEEGVAADGARWRKVCVSSFSAGFGAVRELLEQERYFERIDGLCMLDSIYAGYVGNAADGGRQVNPENMQGFRRFARAAAEGRKTFILTHSYLVPGTYASTIETADDLIAHVGAARTQVDQPVLETPVHIISRASKGDFKVWGCAGTDGEAHMQHLRHMRIWLAKLLPT